MQATVFNSRAHDECFFIFLVLALGKPEFVCRSVYCFCLDWNLVSFLVPKMKMNVGPQAKCRRRLFAIVQMQIISRGS